MYNKSPVQGSSARPLKAHIPDSSIVQSTAQLWYMLGNSPQAPTKTASQTKDWEMCKSNQKENSSDHRSASWREGSRADGNTQVTTSTQLDVDRHGAISRETEMVGWMSASLRESQSHYWFFIFAAQKKKRKQYSEVEETAFIKAFLDLLCIFQTSRKSLSGKSETFTKYIS